MTEIILAILTIFIAGIYQQVRRIANQQNLTVDDATGEKKQQIFDGLTDAIKKTESIV